MNWKLSERYRNNPDSFDTVLKKLKRTIAEYDRDNLFLFTINKLHEINNIEQIESLTKLLIFYMIWKVKVLTI